MKREKFPGFEKCMAMMKSRDGEARETGFSWLLTRAGEYVDQLIEEFGAPENVGLETCLMELIGAAKSPSAFPFLAAQLRSQDWKCRKWAIIGLKNLNTKQARTLLWEAKSFEMATRRDTERLRLQLESPDAWWLD